MIEGGERREGEGSAERRIEAYPHPSPSPLRKGRARKSRGEGDSTVSREKAGREKKDGGGYMRAAAA